MTPILSYFADTEEVRKTPRSQRIYWSKVASKKPRSQRIYWSQVASIVATTKSQYSACTWACNSRLFLSQPRDKIGAEKNKKSSCGLSSGWMTSPIRVRENSKRQWTIFIQLYVPIRWANEIAKNAFYCLKMQLSWLLKKLRSKVDRQLNIWPSKTQLL